MKGAFCISLPGGIVLHRDDFRQYLAPDPAMIYTAHRDDCFLGDVIELLGSRLCYIRRKNRPAVIVGVALTLLDHVALLE